MAETPINPNTRPDEGTPPSTSKGAHTAAGAGRDAQIAAADDPTLNIIQFVVADAPASSGSSKRGKKAALATQNSLEEKAKAKPESSASKIPDSVLERFIPIGNNFYFPDGAEAFSRDSNRLTTRSENAIVIQSMVAIARAESESGIVKVSGTDFFRKEAWFAASLAGLQVEGYTPNEFERERLVRAIASRRGESSPDREDRARDEAKSAGPHDRPEGRTPAEELITGRLVDHGAAHYRHKPNEPMSYFVRIETERGDRDIWGVDLERAFRHSLSNPGIGDEVGLRALGQEAVKVLAVTRDSNGQEIGREPLDTHKNHWSIERKDFLDQRHEMAAVFRDPSLSTDEGIKRHAGLEGAYRQLESGEDYAREQYSSKLHRQQFVEHLRAHLAKSIEYGQPLEPARPRTIDPRTPRPQEPERDFYPAR